MDDKPFELKNKSVFVFADAAGGIYSSAQLKKIAEISQQETAFVKMTATGRVGFMLPAEHVSEVQSQLAAAGLLLKHYHAEEGESVRACLGELCPHAKQDALGDALSLEERLRHVPLHQDVRMGINGCARACVGSGCDDISLIGGEQGYDLYVGGRSSYGEEGESPVPGVCAVRGLAATAIADTLCAVLDTFAKEQQDGESFFHFVERRGAKSLFEEGSASPSSPTEPLTTEEPQQEAPQELSQEPQQEEENTMASTEKSEENALNEDELLSDESALPSAAPAQTAEAAQTPVEATSLAEEEGLSEDALVADEPLREESVVDTPPPVVSSVQSPQNSHQKSARQLKILQKKGHFCIQLNDGVSVEWQGALGEDLQEGCYEVMVGEDTLLLEKRGETLFVKLGPLQVGLPVA